MRADVRKCAEVRGDVRKRAEMYGHSHALAAARNGGADKIGSTECMPASVVKPGNEKKTNPASDCATASNHTSIRTEKYMDC